MTRRVLSINYTDNHASDGIVRIIGVVITICGAAMLFIAGSSGIPALKPRAANAQIPADLPLRIARWHLARTCA
jgi:hypothetical protein